MNFEKRGGGRREKGGFGGERGGLHRGGHRGGGRFRARLLNRGELRALLLKLLEGGAQHGYELIKQIEARTGGAYAPSPGVLYPTLAMLEDAGLISAASDGGRKQFALTDTGRAEIAEKAEELDALLLRLEEEGKTRATTESGPVRRAMDNLGQVLRELASRAELDREAQHTVADILDDAARRIERL